MRAFKYEKYEIYKAQRMVSDRSALISAVIIMALIVIFSIELYMFARAQDIWADETTQLSGITLSPREMLRWLLGTDEHHLGVPLDRMPPVSYMIDWLWLRLAGPSEFGFRLFHSAFVVAGVAMLAIAALRRMGTWAAMVVLAFSLLSPKLIATAVEVRAYPIFFAVTCAQVVVFLRLVSTPNRLNLKMLVAFTAFCLIAVYTHFYGFVSSCAFFLALGCACIRSRSSLIAVAIGFSIVVIASLGIFPFALNSISVTKKITDSSPMSGNEIVVGEYLRYLFGVLWFLFTLVGDNANMISIFGSVLFVAGASALLTAAMVVAFVHVRHGNPRPFDWLSLSAIAGASVPLIAIILFKIFNVKIFDPVLAKYSGWLFAPLTMLIASGAISLTGFQPWDRGGRFGAVGSMFIGAVLATYVFFTHAAMFVHGPQGFVGEIYDGVQGPKAIIYKDGDPWWFFSYVPLFFSHKGKIVQYGVATDGTGLVQIGDVDSQLTAPRIRSTIASYNHLLIVDVQRRTALEMRECLYQTGLCPNFAQGSVETLLTGGGRWREVREERSYGEFDTQVKILERVSELTMP
jgi:hypothetical protein